MKKNQKGFLLSEALVVATVLLTALVVIYAQYSRIYNKLNSGKEFNTENAVYIADEAAKYLTNADLGDIAKTCKSTNNYVELNATTCPALTGITNLKTTLGIANIYLANATNIDTLGITGGSWPSYLPYLNLRINNSANKPANALLILVKTTTDEYGYGYLTYSN